MARVAVEYEGAVASVRLTRPEKRNALDFAMFEALEAALDELAGRGGVRAVVLSGEGPSFCSGLDFPSFMAEGRDIAEVMLAHRGVAHGWRRLPVPVIAALRGHCIGGGAQIALGADVRIAGPDVSIAIAEVRYGLIPDMGISQALPALVGLDVAKELTWTGRPVGAEEALRLGLVTRVADDPLAAAEELAAQVAARSPDAIRRAKRLLEEAYRSVAEQSLALEEALQRELLGSPNQIEAVRAALAGEPASFADPD